MVQVLEQLENDHPLPKMILEHRSRFKLLNGFLIDICSRVRRPSIGQTGRNLPALVCAPGFTLSGTLSECLSQLFALGFTLPGTCSEKLCQLFDRVIGLENLLAACSQLAVSTTPCWLNLCTRSCSLANCNLNTICFGELH